MAKNEDEIRLIAYSLWQQEGYPNGKDYEHWIRAEAIWEEKQKAKAIPNTTRIETKPLARKTTKVMPAKKKS